MEHLGLVIDTVKGEFRAPAKKLSAISSLARDLLCGAARHKRWVPVRHLASLAGKAQFLYLAIPAARFYLRELHDVVSHRASWSAKVKISNQLRRDLQWWVSVPTEQNGRPIWTRVETAYLHVDSSGYGWGAVLNDRLHARGFWTPPDLDQHITFKELKAVRYAVLSFLSHLRGRQVLLHEDNQAVVSVLTHLTTKSADMMSELRKLWFLLDTNDIHIRTRYIRSAANIWADHLSRLHDNSDWAVNPKIFRHLDKLYGPHSIDRFASMENRQLPRYNSKWRDPLCEDCLHLPDQAWRQEHNWCNPPWDLMDDLIAKLTTSGASATVVAPHWPAKSWYQRLSEMASEVTIYPATRDFFFPGRLAPRAGVGTPVWSTAVFVVPSRPGST